jgi:YD repeat-containing protein
MYRKAQAAMEFLMTYGWAILVVLVAIGALAYFGVLNPGKFLPSSCTIGPGLACGEFKVTNTAANNTIINVRNGMGKNIEGITMTLNQASNNACTGVVVPTNITDGAQDAFEFTCSDASGANVGDRFKATLTFTYTAAGETMSHTMTGDITTKVE